MQMFRNNSQGFRLEFNTNLWLSPTDMQQGVGSGTDNKISDYHG